VAKITEEKSSFFGNDEEKTTEVTIRIIVTDTTNFSAFPPPDAAACDANSATLATTYDGVFQSVAECKEFVAWTACPV
jgi:hypothetical protein